MPTNTQALHAALTVRFFMVHTMDMNYHLRNEHVRLSTLIMDALKHPDVLPSLLLWTQTEAGRLPGEPAPQKRIVLPPTPAARSGQRMRTLTPVRADRDSDYARRLSRKE